MAGNALGFSGTVAVDGATDSDEISANITTGVLVKTGDGTLTVSGSNSFSGGTTCSKARLSSPRRPRCPMVRTLPSAMNLPLRRDRLRLRLAFSARAANAAFG